MNGEAWKGEWPQRCPFCWDPFGERVIDVVLHMGSHHTEELRRWLSPPAAPTSSESKRVTMEDDNG